MLKTFALVLLCGLAAPAQEKPAKPARNPKDAHAVIAGTVFRDPGFALSGAQVLLQPEPGAKTSFKLKRMKTVSDTRGEFSFWVPPAASQYTLTFQANGFEPETRKVTISGEERQDVFVTLKSAKEASK